MTEELDIYLGKVARDIDPETVKLLIGKGYSISPKSGRVRRRVRSNEDKSIIYKTRVKRYTQIVSWIIVVALFIYCISILVPQLSVQKKGSDKPNTTK